MGGGGAGGGIQISRDIFQSRDVCIPPRPGPVTARAEGVMSNKQLDFYVDALEVLVKG